MRHIGLGLVFCGLFGSAWAQQQPASFDPADFGKIVIQPRQSASGDIVYEQAFGNYQNEPISKYGEDSPAIRLGRPIGRLDMLFENGTTGFCTAFIVDDNHVLTNHHCVPGMDRDPAGKNSGLQAAQLVMGYVKPGITEGVDRYTISPTIVETNRELDYSVLQVFGDPAAVYGTMALVPEDPENGEFLWIIGHPQGQSQHISREGCGASSPAISGEGKLMHTCDTLAGNSGSPVIRLSDKAVVGLHHAGDSRSGFNMAIPMSRILAVSDVLKPADGMQIRKAPPARTVSSSPSHCAALWRDAKAAGCAGYETYLESCGSHAFSAMARRYIERSCMAAEAAPSIERGGVTITVGPSGADFSNIAAAVDAAPEGARIEVAPGVYSQPVVVRRSVEIVGKGPRDAVRLEVTGQDAVRWSAPWGRISGFAIAQSGFNGSAVKVVDGALDLRGNDLTSHGNAIVLLEPGTRADLHQNMLRDGARQGVLAKQGAVLAMEDNELSANGLAGLEAEDGASLRVARNVFRDGRDAGIVVAPDATGTITDNTVSGSAGVGMHIRGTAKLDVTGNEIAHGMQGGVLVSGRSTARLSDNRISGNALSGIEVRDTSAPEVAGNDISRNGQSGLYLHSGASGVFRDNDMWRNGYHGISAKGQARPFVRDNTFRDNGYAAIRISDGAGGDYENNDLSGNRAGGFDIADDAGPVLRRGNSE